ncbi:alanine racemase [Lipingzhangella sp. LS1_29]|uniref:Alanine racemase n=1 Tax=Lipingzhangella rawalii TaxID=2055835 RepID=A0ABU2H3X0_9ACTN|nr:alanine racemase [Lipingzhangella rawalii]MDS1269995.1 alanine racemase [Lipingzhangella rawalii]
MPSPPQPSSHAAAQVDLDAIRSNIALLADRASGAAVMGVVKADGYGHGMLPAARAMLAGGATWLGVAFVEEALQLRAAGIQVPTVAWILPPGADLATAITADIDLGVSDARVLDAVADAAGSVGRSARVHLKVDTGLTRGGVPADQWPAVVESAARAEATGRIHVVGVFSHFACADEPGHSSIDAQISAFHTALGVVEKAGLEPRVRHLANSAATLTRPETHFDLVRPGIASYGICPIPELTDTGLRPAMTLSSDLALVKPAPAGSGVSYGHRYITDRDTRVALVPLGYGDGVPRNATNRAEVAIAGDRFPIAGTVCMDQFMVDVGDAPVPEDGRVHLFGPGDAGEPTAQDWAGATGTIPYEIVTRISPRVPRVYIGDQ